MPAVGDIITGLVPYAPSATIRAVGPVKSVFGARFFAQLRSPLNGKTYNVYFNAADEYVQWAPGDQTDASGTPFGSNTTTLLFDGVQTGALQLDGYPATGLPNYRTQAWVKSLGAWFDLGPSTGAAQPLVTIDTNDGRQWIRRLAVNQEHLAFTFWSVSTQHGSDEAVGCGMTESDADAHPLRTYHEVNRRIFGWNQNNTCAGLSGVAISIHNLDDVNTADTFTVLTSITSASYDKYVRVRGTLTPVDENATNRVIAGYVPAVPDATNTEREIIIAGLGLAPQYVETIIQSVDGLRTALVTRQNAPDRLSICQVRDGGSFINGVAVPSNVADFAVDDHVNFLRPTKLGAWPFPTTALFRLLGQVQLTQNQSDDLVCYGENGPNYTVVTQSLLGAGVPGEYEYSIDGGALYITSSGIFATHVNSFSDGSAQWNSIAVFPHADGPLFEGAYALGITDEVTFAGSPGGPGIRNIGDGLVTVAIENDGTIASFGMHGPTIDLLNVHNGIPGDFAGSTVLDSFSRWYGKDNAGLLLVLPKGTRSKFPKAGLTVVTSNPYAINLAGKGVSDPDHNYNWTAIPIILTTTSLTQLADSTPDEE